MNSATAPDSPVVAEVTGHTVQSILLAWLARDGASVNALSKGISVSRQSIHNWKQGRTEPTASDLVKLLDAVAATPKERRVIWARRMEIDPIRLRQVVGITVE